MDQLPSLWIQMIVKSKYLSFIQTIILALIITIIVFPLFEFLGFHKITYFYLRRPIITLILDSVILFTIIYLLVYVRHFHYYNVKYSFNKGHILYMKGKKTFKLFYDDIKEFRLKRDLYGIFGFFKIRITLNNEKKYSFLMNKEYESIFLRWINAINEEKESHFDFYQDKLFTEYIENHVINRK